MNCVSHGCAAPATPAKPATNVNGLPSVENVVVV